MKTTTKFNRSGRAERSAFTLVELMVVITIIAALVALSASAVLKFIEVQQTSNTQSTLDRVQSQLARAWSKVKDDALKAPMTEIVPGVGVSVSQWILTNLAQIGASDPNAQERVRVIYIKLKLRQTFPMNFNEAANPFPLPPLPGYFNLIAGKPSGYLGNLGITGTYIIPPGTNIDPATGLPETSAKYESSVCLLMALQRGVSGAGINPSDLTAGGAAGSLITPGGPGGNAIPYLTDAWARPIFFSRVPSGNLYLNPAGAPLAGANDPGDPQGYLNSPPWVGSAAGTLFTTLTLQPVAAGASFKLAPMVASGGPYNWVKYGTTTFNPVTFAPVLGMDALFSTP